MSTIALEPQTSLLPLTELPPIAGREAEIAAIMHDDLRSIADHRPQFYPTRSNLPQAAFACALHMHQPTVPAGANGRLISHLQYMFEHSGEGDNHNAGVFAWCYERMGDFIPELVAAGCEPRIMLDYSGNLLWGLQQMGRSDILDKLKHLATHYPIQVEWLGTMWSHAVAPSTPIPDLKLQIRAWQHQFLAIFGAAALSRVRGFSPPEMHLPNHPDTLYEYIKALKECGYEWLLVQEHSIETLDGHGIPQDQKYGPNQLVARNSQDQTISIPILIKTQGSDTKLVAQMQPYHEAKTKGPQTIGGIEIPSLVSQIADGENGGVMMNEFPRDFPPVWHQIRESGSVIGLNGTEYLELVAAAGLKAADYPAVQAVGQHRIWQRLDGLRPTGGHRVTPETVAEAIADLKATENFAMEGASWTNDLSWVAGYENVLEPMNQLSAQFHAKFDAMVAADPGVTARSDYQQALLYNLLLQTSCFRYWGQGQWTDYAQALYRAGVAALS
ncbi:MAG: hypothetical protein RLZZ511_1187 [Cyanobacteriota bacterium]|jgi:hypothetical protein